MGDNSVPLWNVLRCLIISALDAKTVSCGYINLFISFKLSSILLVLFCKRERNVANYNCNIVNH